MGRIAPHRPCVAVGCQSIKSAASAVSFFTFPKEPTKRKAWERNVGRKGWTASNESLLCSEHFTADCYDADVHLMSQFGIPKKRRLRADATPTVFAHRPMLQAKRRGAFEKRQRKEIIDALLRDSTVAQEQPASSSSVPTEFDILEFSHAESSKTLFEEAGIPESSSSVPAKCDILEFSDTESSRTPLEEAGTNYCNLNPATLNPETAACESCDANRTAEHCSKFVQVTLSPSCRSVGTQATPKGVSSSTQTLGTFVDKKNCSLQTEI